VTGTCSQTVYGSLRQTVTGTCLRMSWLS
jgi:hypothetical protein